MLGVGVAPMPVVVPPSDEVVDGEVGGVVGGADEQAAVVGGHVRYCNGIVDETLSGESFMEYQSAEAFKVVVEVAIKFNGAQRTSL